MLDALVNLLGPYVVLFALVAILLLLVWIANLHPLFALVIGLAFLAVPILQFATFDRRLFQSEGSAAGLVFFLVYAVVGLICGSLGASFTTLGVANFARGNQAPLASRRNLIVIACFAAVVILAMQAWRAKQVFVPEPRTRTHVDEEIRRNVAVGDSYALAWKARTGAPRMQAMIPSADFARKSSEPLSIAETVDGPLSVELALPHPDARRASLKLYRDDGHVADPILDTLDLDRPADPEAPWHFWVKTDGGAWTLLGFACKPGSVARFPALSDPRLNARAIRCHEPEAPMARWVPVTFGLEHVRLHAEEDRGRGTCEMSFRYRERVATVTSAGKCFEASSLAALAGGVELLGRLASDTRQPVSADTGVARARDAVARCEEREKALRAGTPGSRENNEIADSAREVCGQALGMAAAFARTAPEASDLALRVLEARGDLGSITEVPAIDAILETLAAAGKSESRDALRAHVLRILRLSRSVEPQHTRAVEPSLEALLSLPPKVLAAADPLVDTIWRVIPDRSTDPASHAPRVAASLRAWQEKAEAAAPGSDAALKARYRLCIWLHGHNIERETAGECADRLFAAWQERAAKGLGFEVFQTEADLANRVSTLYVTQAYVTGDFGGVLPVVQRVHRFSVERLSAVPGIATLFAEFEQREKELAAKSQGRGTGAK